MSNDASISLSSGLPATVLPPPPVEWAQELRAASESADAARVAGDHPTYLEAWAVLAELALARGDDVTAYAFARVGYHRGLDALRAAGWRGSGYVRWSEPTNHGFLRSLDALRQAAGSIGETDEEERCRVFLRQLDPAGRPSGV